MLIKCKTSIFNIKINSQLCQSINTKTLNSSSYNNQSLTQVRRAVNSIQYSLGGNTVFGNPGTQNIVFLGKTEGQTGGITGPLKNKF